jgi:hypothetical protein
MASLAFVMAAVASELALDPLLVELLAHPFTSHSESSAVDSSLT